ncbi:MAG: phage major capsid protein [Gammaproteobacteria bacterium]|nr:MAG: phage major capsid protein [Gammaproteobacteria bacterium]
MESTELATEIQAYHQDVKAGVQDIKATLKKHAEKQEELSDRLLDIEQRANPDTGTYRTPAPRSAASALLKADEVKAFAEKRVRAVGVAVEARDLLPSIMANTLTSDSATNPAQQLLGVVGGPVQRTWLRQYLSTVAATSASFVYTKESTFTNNAAAQSAEGAAKAESDLTFTEVTEPVSTIAHYLRMSRQLLDDNDALRQFVDTRLHQGLELAIEDDIINGDGTSGKMNGLLKSGNYTAFTPTGTDKIVSLREAKLDLESADYRAGLIVMHPDDVAEIELVKDSNGNYVVGLPINGCLPQLWGVPVYSTTKVTSGNFIMMDLTAVGLHQRMDAVVELSDSDANNFTTNLVTIRAETRLSVAVYLPAGVVSGALST